MIPNGIIIDDSNKSNIIIKTKKRELVFGDYFGIFFVIWGFILLILGRFAKNFDNTYYTFAAIFAAVLLIILMSLILTFSEHIVIVITNESLEILKKTFLFARRTKLDRKLIERIDYKVIKSPQINIILNFRLLFGFANFKLPRIVYNGNEIFIFQNYNREIRMWAIDYLNSQQDRIILDRFLP